MPAPSKYPAEVRDRAVRMVNEKLTNDPTLAVSTACRLVGEQIGINKNTLRNWVKQNQVDSGKSPGMTSDDKQRISDLEKEIRELRRANEILRKASLDSNRHGNTSGFRVVRSCWASSGVRKLKHFRGRVLSS